MLQAEKPQGVGLQDAGYLLNRVEVERMGRWISFGRAAATTTFLAFLALPLSFAVVGWLPRQDERLPLDVLTRVSLVLETLLLVAVVITALRALELVRSAGAPRRVHRLARVLFVATVVVCAIDLAENAWLGFVLGGEPQAWTTEFNVAVVVAGAVLLLAGAALALVSSPSFWWRRERGEVVRRFRMPPRFLGVPTRRFVELGTGAKGPDLSRVAQRSRAMLSETEQVPADQPAPDGTIICCSGGGIRSASFCLGGLQTLADPAHRIYQRSRAVVGVSGGGYIAAAFHVMRWRSGDGWQPLNPPAFAPDTPEMRWLRRHSRYLVESVRVATLGFLALLYGIAVNLAWLGLTMIVTAAWLALFLLTSGGLSGLDTTDASGAAYAGEWAWVRWVLLLSALGVVLFVMERMAERFVTVLHATRERIKSIAVVLIWLGLGLGVVLVAAPAGMAAVHDWVVRSDSVWAGLAHQVGLVPTEVCNLRLPVSDACGVSAATTESNTPPPSRVALPASLATVVAAIIAVVQAARANLSADGRSSGRSLATIASKVWVKVRDVVVPWVAAVVVGAVVLVTVWRLTVGLVVDPTPLSQWWRAAALVGFAIVLRLTTDANRTSLHHFYRERLSYAYLLSREGRRARPLKYREAVRFSESAPPPGKGPELVSCAVANVSDTAYVPSDRHGTPFVFDARGMGLTDDSLPSGPCLTSSVIYERSADGRARDATLAGALAISGAAFSPLVGRQNVRVGPYRAVLALGNARLGVWLPNPIWVDDVAETRLLVQRRLVESVRAFSQLRPVERDRVLDRLCIDDRVWFGAECWSWYRAQTPEVRERFDIGLRTPRRVEWLVEVARRDLAAYLPLDRAGRTAFRDRLAGDERRRLDLLAAPELRREYDALGHDEGQAYLEALPVEELGRLQVSLADQEGNGRHVAESTLSQEVRALRHRRRADDDLLTEYESWDRARRAERQRWMSGHAPLRFAQLRARLDDRRWLAARAGADETDDAPSPRRLSPLRLQDLAGMPDAALDDTGSTRVPLRVSLQWVARDLFGKPGPFRLAKEAFGRTSVLDRRLYVTDGGHYDNLGLVEALRRRPEEVFVLDASSDPEDSFRALGDAIATARIDLGVEIQLKLSGLMRGKDKEVSDAAWTSGVATYPDDTTARVHLVKVIMVGDLPWDTESYKRINPEFPRTSTGRQLYGEFDLEAYRILGRELTARLLRDRAKLAEAGPAVPAARQPTADVVQDSGAPAPRL